MTFILSKWCVDFVVICKHNDAKLSPILELATIIVVIIEADSKIRLNLKDPVDMYIAANPYQTK